MSTKTSDVDASVDLADVQGLLRFGFKHLTQASFLLLRVKDRDAARAWLAAAPLTTAVTANPPPITALQAALTSDGLRALGVPAEIVESFSPEFVSGMGTEASRARRLGDVGTNDPKHWAWGTADRVPHVLLLLYAAPGLLADFQMSIKTQCRAGFEELACLSTSDMDGVEPFGFVDGISQPQIDWQRERHARDEEQREYANLACLGEFLLGYPNEYGGYTERPLLDATRDAGAALPRAEDDPAKADLGRNGSYLIMRQLRQDVQGFWQYLDRQAGGDPALRERWAQAMVGRTVRGEPLIGRTGTSIASTAKPEENLNAFDYRSDPQGLRCPLGAHVRRTNPRNADLPAGGPGLISRLVRALGFDAAALDKDLVASTRFHRLLRRGREYGAQVSLEQALAGVPADTESGLHFICLGANIARQFEFVQGAWVIGTKFDGLRGEGDPLLGHRHPGPDGTPTDGFSMPRPGGADAKLSQLPSFVTVLGGAYFFLPGIRALRCLAALR